MHEPVAPAQELEAEWLTGLDGIITASLSIVALLLVIVSCFIQNGSSGKIQSDRSQPKKR